MVSEELADCFAVEVMGKDAPIWSLAVTGSELESLIETARINWNKNPYDHGKWFFGISSDIPRWTGYSVGYRLVKEYLSENPTRTPSGLHNEPAGSIVSRYCTFKYGSILQFHFPI